MRIGLLQVDGKIPNLALMKISAYHKGLGDNTELFNPDHWYDKVYASKIFNFSPDYNFTSITTEEIETGGTGYSITKTLPLEIDRLQPDYSLYPGIHHKTAYGFLTRGCPNKCKWCIVPKKEGAIAPYMDIDEIAVGDRTNVTLFDNNILASDYGLHQIEKIVERRLRVDFNQGLDARLVTPEIAQLLVKVRWQEAPWFGCDTPKQIGECERVISLLRKYGYEKRVYLFTMLNDDFGECLERVSHWRYDLRIMPFCLPYRDPFNPAKEPPTWQRDMARWCNRRQYYKSCTFDQYQPRKNFCCSEYITAYKNHEPLPIKILKKDLKKKK